MKRLKYFPISEWFDIYNLLYIKIVRYVRLENTEQKKKPMSNFMLNSSSDMSGKEHKHNQNDSDNDLSHIDPIPHDLVLEILRRLPVKSLLKFQYVSKTWGSIIRSKGFINSCVSMSSAPSSRLLISFRNGRLTNKNAENLLFFFTSSQDQEDDSSSLVANLDMTMASMGAYCYTRCASVNGFICVSNKRRVMICNPSTRQIITLPEIPGDDLKSAYKYLGYDPINDQYKAMCKLFPNSEDDQEHMVLTLGGDQEPSWRHIEGTSRSYLPLTKGICIDGFVYYGALTPTPSKKNRVIVCFDVRSERLSFINLPALAEHVHWGSTSTLINYKGKLANIINTNACSYEDRHYNNFDLWVLQDAKEHQWSMGSCSFRLDDSLGKVSISFQGTNRIGEIVIAPKFLPRDLRPFYILYYNVESNSLREVKLEGVADDEDFRRRYQIGRNGNCDLYISPEHVTNFTFL